MILQIEIKTENKNDMVDKLADLLLKLENTEDTLSMMMANENSSVSMVYSPFKPLKQGEVYQGSGEAK
jgi:hypothetical protein